MEESFILVENVSQKDLTNVIKSFANLYSDIEFVEGIQLYRKSENTNSFLIQFSNQPDFEIFCYLVNYIKYLKGFR